MFAWRALPPARRRGGGATGGPPGACLTVPALERTGIRALWTTRLGGESGEPFRSLNLSFVSGDDPAVVWQNRERALAGVGAEPGAWTSGRQVHGAGVRRVGTEERGAGAREPGTTLPDTDAMWTDLPGVALAVLCADCLPILVADPARGRIAVVHAGWRGLVAGVVGAAVRAMEPGPGAVALIGPAIGPCCYEVGPEVADAAREALADERVARDQRLDLWRGAGVALRAAGVSDVRTAALCTRCEPHRFYSHRAGDAARQGLVATIDGG